MVAAVEQRFGPINRLPATIEWLTDNGSCYIAGETRKFAREIGLEPLTTPVKSPQSNGMAEAFVRTIKRDYVRVNPAPDERKPSSDRCRNGSTTTTNFTRIARWAIVRRVSSSPIGQSKRLWSPCPEIKGRQQHTYYQADQRRTAKDASFFRIGTLWFVSSLLCLFERFQQAS